MPTDPITSAACRCPDPLREVHPGCPLHGHSPEKYREPGSAACRCPDPLREVHPGCPLHGHSPEKYREPGSAARTTPGYCSWWSTKPDDRDIILLQARAWASMATLPSHVEVRPAYSNGHLGWAAFIERDGAPCRHCGQGPDDDGDHSCPCPYRDEECPDHG